METGAQIFKDHQETERTNVENKSLIIAADTNKKVIHLIFEKSSPTQTFKYSYPSRLEELFVV